MSTYQVFHYIQSPNINQQKTIRPTDEVIMMKPMMKSTV